MKGWTCLKNIVLQKGLTRVSFYKGIDALGEIRYIITTDTYGAIGSREEVTKERGNELFSKLVSEGYEKYWERIQREVKAI